MNKEMTAKQNAKLNMYRTNEKHIADNASIIADNPAFQTAFNKFKANIAAIQSVAQQKSAALTGVAADKANARQALCKLTANIAGFVYAYAAANQNETLKQEMNFSLTALQRTRDEALAPRCQNIHDKAAANLDALADYGVKKAHLTNLQTAINDYSSKTMNPRAAISGRKTATTNLAALFKENDRILKDQLDKLIEQFREAHPDFVQTYHSTREIVEPPTTTTQLRGIVTDKSAGTPIKNATVTIVELGKSTLTGAPGKYSFKSIPNGQYTVTATASGFAAFQAEAVEVKLGTINTLDIEMVV
jgi:DNA repair exonuclease SbcCD ATPase subunit